VTSLVVPSTTQNISQLFLHKIPDTLPMPVLETEESPETKTRKAAINLRIRA
jgi:hypothetical protein